MKVIVNADDMGMSDKVNRSIIKMHKMGVVTSTTLMANAPRFNEAIELLSTHTDLGVGVHLCLDGPYHSNINYRTLIDPDKGSFYEKEEVIKKIRSSYFDKEEIFSEFCLQVEKVRDQGIRVSHLDSHHHLHLYYPILSQVIRVARKYDIPFIRSQRLYTCIPKGRANKLYRYLHYLYLNTQLKSVKWYYDPELEKCADHESNLHRLEKMFQSGRGILEIMLHPAGDDDPETSFFSSKRIVDLFSRQTLLNYHKLK